MEENEIVLKTSIIDYMDPINNGITILIGITLYEFTFQAIYWTDKEGMELLECEDRFLRLWGMKNTVDLPFYDFLINDINSILPDKSEIFKEFSI